MKALFILQIIFFSAQTFAFDYVGKDPAPKNAQAFALTVTGTNPLTAFEGPFSVPSQKQVPGFLGNGFVAVDSEKKVWRVTCQHVLTHWSQDLLGSDVVGFRLNDAPANPPEIGVYREGYNVTIASWVPENGTLVWRQVDARSRRIPEYRAEDVSKEMASVYAKSAPSGKFPDIGDVRIAEILKVGKQPKMVPGVSGSAVYQNGKVVGIVIAGPDGHSSVSDGTYFEVLAKTRKGAK